MKRTVDQTYIRSINQRVILDQIFSSDTVSRSELSQKLAISKSAMTENISSLLDIGIIKEVGSGQAASSGGRRPIMLKFNKTFRYIIAIDLSYEDAIFVLANLSGEIENKFTIQISSNSTYLTRLDLVKSAINMLLSSKNILAENLVTIAISSPGIMDPVKKQFLANKQFINWQMKDLLADIKEIFHTETMIVNDVNAASVGELHHGAGKSYQNIIYVSCGLGLGAGLIINGKLYSGTSRSAGEIANFILNPTSPQKLEENVCIGSLLEKIYTEAPADTLENLGPSFGFRDVLNRWKSGDEFLVKCVEDISNILGFAISNIVSLLNIDLVIVGGEYTSLASQMMPIINEKITAHAFAPVEAVPSSLDKYSGTFGLITIVQNQFFKEICTRPTQRSNNTKKV